MLKDEQKHAPLARTKPIEKNLLKTGLSSMYIFTHNKKLPTNQPFRALTDCSLFSTDLQFLSFRTVQKMHNGAALQTFFFILFPQNESCQLKRLALIEVSQETPNKEKSNYHKALVMVQCNRIYIGLYSCVPYMTRVKLPQTQFTQSDD